MSRAFVCFGALVVLALPCRADQSSSSPETLIRLSVTPAPAPTPALRYRLLPELKEMNPGNPVQGYFKAFMENQTYLFDAEAFERRAKLLVMPIEDVPAEELREYGPRVLTQADLAARLDKPDWQVLRKLKTEGFTLLIPEVQQMRALARALQVRFHSEVVAGRFDDAVRTAQTMFAMARHLGEHPCLIGAMVGISIANTAIGPLEEMLEQPGCPNLYWALTNLPTPLVPLDKALDGERVMAVAEFRALDDKAPMSAAQIKKFATRWDNALGVGQIPENGKGVQAWLAARNKDEATLSAARRRLIECGFPEERLRRFPADQVILLDEKRACEVRTDDLMKTMTLPLWQGEALTAQLTANNEPALCFGAVLPAVTKGRRVQVRLDQRIALLRHVEALRLHAAEHGGAFPAKLTDMSVPLPDDPFTGKPFRYEVQDNTAHLRGTAPPGEEKNFGFNVHYEVTVQE